MFAVSRRCRSGFTLVELLVVIAIIGVLIALMLPAVQTARESARRTQCFNNLKQYGLAAHNFHQQYNRMPPYWSENNITKFPDGGWLVHLLPYLEQQSAYDLVVSEKMGRMSRSATMTSPPSDDYTPPISIGNGGFWQPIDGDPSDHMGHTFDPIGSIWVGPPNTTIPGTGTPAQYSYGATGVFKITDLSFPALHCLSDPSTVGPSKRVSFTAPGYGGTALSWSLTNYQANFLAWVQNASQQRVGVEWEVGGPPLTTANAPKLEGVMGYRDITDGLSNTIMFAEGMRFCDQTYRFAFWSKYQFRHSHNFGVDWNGKGNTFMFQSIPHRTRCNNWRVQGLHFGTLATCQFDGSVRAIQKTITRREISDPDYPTVGVDAVFVSSDSNVEFDGVWDRLMMPVDGAAIGSF